MTCMLFRGLQGLLIFLLVLTVVGCSISATFSRIRKEKQGNMNHNALLLPPFLSSATPSAYPPPPAFLYRPGNLGIRTFQDASA